MPLFSVPVISHSGAPHSRVRFSSLPFRTKRKRSSSSSPSLSEDDAISQYARSDAAASTNPLSLTPAEVIQYRLAGLGLDEEIPKAHGWPHKRLPAENPDGTQQFERSSTEDKERALIQESRDCDEAPGDRQNDVNQEIKIDRNDYRQEKIRGSLRYQHLAVLTAILHKCLLTEDIPRASRAWAILIRAQFGGHGIDLRASEYWAIGAELLIRNGEMPHKREPRQSSDEEDENELEQEQEQISRSDIGEANRKRYGTAIGLDQAKKYYERLILQYPYNRRIHHAVSALDFWPAMIGCEIYGIQYEQQQSLQRIAASDGEREHKNSEDSHGEFESDVIENEDQDESPSRYQHKKERFSDERRWQESNKIRKSALLAYEAIATRLDELMITPPYSDSHEMKRLRGMLALCIGDLSVPALPINKEESEDSLDANSRLKIDEKDTNSRLLDRQRIADHEFGKRKCRQEHSRAMKLFESIETGSRKKSAMNGPPPDQELLEKDISDTD